MLNDTPTLTRPWKKPKPRNEAPEVGVGARRPKELLCSPNGCCAERKLGLSEPAHPSWSRKGTKSSWSWGRAIQEASLALHTPGHSLSNSL